MRLLKQLCSLNSTKSNFLKCSSFFLQHKQVFCQTNNGQNHFVPVYKFPYMQAIGIVNKLKKYQLGLTLGCFPISYSLFDSYLMTAEEAVFAVTLASAGCLSLFSAGQLFVNYVGIMYLNEAEQKVRLAYCNFWGQRQQVDIPLEDWVPLSDLPVRWMDGLYVTIKRFNNSDKYKLNVKLGLVLDIKLYKKLC